MALVAVFAALRLVSTTGSKDSLSIDRRCHGGVCAPGPAAARPSLSLLWTTASTRDGSACTADIDCRKVSTGVQVAIACAVNPASALPALVNLPDVPYASNQTAADLKQPNLCGAFLACDRMTQWMQRRTDRLPQTILHVTTCARRGGLHLDSSCSHSTETQRVTRAHVQLSERAQRAGWLGFLAISSSLGVSPLRNQDNQVEEDYTSASDPLDPVFYSTCYQFVRSPVSGFLDVPAWTYEPPTWAVGVQCVECALNNSRCRRDVSQVPDWTTTGAIGSTDVSQPERPAASTATSSTHSAAPLHSKRSSVEPAQRWYLSRGSSSNGLKLRS